MRAKGWAALMLLLASSAASAREYSVVYDEQKVVVGGKRSEAITVNGTIPGPVLRFRQGEQVVVRVTNRMDTPTSVHWHGLILPGDQDGVPGFNGFKEIQPGETRVYSFPAKQSGTYWYHAHSPGQEQRGHYGPLIIDPAGAPRVMADREHVVMLSDFIHEDPKRVLNNLKVDPGYYNYAKRTLPDFIRDVGKFGFKKAMEDRFAWGRMRMDPTDISDVGGGYTYLLNGQTAAQNPTLVFKPGEKVLLRLINGATMSYFDVRIPGAKMTVLAADGADVEPVTVDELRMAVAETYDVLVEPTTGQPLTFFAEAIDRTGFARATLATSAGRSAEVPKMRRRALLTMAEMGHNTMPGMDHSTMGAGGPPSGSASVAGAVDPAAMGHAAPAAAPSAPTVADSSCPPAHAAMGHCPPTGAMPADPHAGHTKSAPAAPVNDPKCPPEHAAMGHCTPKASPDAGAADQAPPVANDAAAPVTEQAGDHSEMGHGSMPANPGGATTAVQGAAPVAQAPAPMTGTATGHAAMGHSAMAGRTALPKIDYGMGREVQMAGMDHSSMNNGEGLGEEGQLDGSGRVFGWASGAPYGSRVLSYTDLRAAEPAKDVREPEREIVVRLGGNMERYIWTLNGKKFEEAEPIRLRHGERVRLTFINETMMAHPMHLHGMFIRIENGQPMDRLPEKSVVSVAPGKTYSALISAEYPGEWAFHCHLLFHMEAGMMRKVTVARYDGTPPSEPAAAPHASHGGQ